MNELKTMGIKPGSLAANESKQFDFKPNDSSLERKSHTSSITSISSSKMEALNIELLDENPAKNPKPKKNPRINVNLLSRALVAYAFGQQHLNADSDRVSTNMMEKVSSRWSIISVIKRFLTSDLQLILLNNMSNKGHGIVYHTEDDVLYISGTPNRNVKDKVIVIQVKTARNRVLRELWLYGETGSSKEVELVNDSIYETQGLIL